MRATRYYGAALGSRAAGPLTFDHALRIGAPATRILAAFFDPAALSAWWQVARSVTVARPLGVYAVEWSPTPFRDELLGRLGGVFYGTVVDFRPAREFFVGDAYWLPPDGDALGPMGLEVRCVAETATTRMRVVQSGFQTDARWRRYHTVVEAGWKTSLQRLKTYLEQGPPRHR